MGLEWDDIVPSSWIIEIGDGTWVDGVSRIEYLFREIFQEISEVMLKSILLWGSWRPLWVMSLEGD